MVNKTASFLVFLICSLTVSAQNTVIKAGHFFDARKGKMLKNQIIVIQDGKIKEIGINPKFKENLLTFIKSETFKDIEVRNDIFGKNRMLKAVKP